MPLGWVPPAFVGLIFVAGLVLMALSSRRSTVRRAGDALGSPTSTEFRGSVLWSTNGVRSHGGTPLRLYFFERGVQFRPRFSLFRTLLPTIEILYSEIEFVDAITLPLVYIVTAGTGVRVRAAPLPNTVIVFMSGDWYTIIDEFLLHGVNGRKETVKGGVSTLD
jgi:hypothetical protein